MPINTEGLFLNEIELESRSNMLVCGQPPLSKDQSQTDYHKLALERGFYFGTDLVEKLKYLPTRNSYIVTENSPISSNNRLIAQFKTQYGETNQISQSKNNYICLGVMVPSREHVSEIVGKGGNKIKELRCKTGALIVTPNENDQHMFLIEGPPKIAFTAAEQIKTRAIAISNNKIVANKLSNQSYDSLKKRSNCVSPGILRRSEDATVNGRQFVLRDRITVPQDLVGRIIGTQGSIITTVQRDTGTEIRSPPREPGQLLRENADFEISVLEGQAANLDEARRRITTAKQYIAHLAVRHLQKSDSEIYAELLADDKDYLLNTPSSKQSIPCWRWPELTPMPPDEAKDVIDRILTESKLKSRQSLPNNKISEDVSNNLSASTGIVKTFSGQLSQKSVCNSEIGQKACDRSLVEYPPASYLLRSQSCDQSRPFGLGFANFNQHNYEYYAEKPAFSTGYFYNGVDFVTTQSLYSVDGNLSNGYQLFAHTDPDLGAFEKSFDSLHLQRDCWSPIKDVGTIGDKRK